MVTILGPDPFDRIRYMNPQRNVRRTHAVFFAHNGRGPWQCFFCSDVVLKIGQKTWDGNIHHRDNDVTNDAAENLVVGHTVCHQRVHPPTDEQKLRISQTLKGRTSPTKGMTFSTEVNAKKSMPGERNPFYGKKHDTSSLQKMRTPRQRLVCTHCGKTYAVNWIERHRSEGKCIARQM